MIDKDVVLGDSDIRAVLRSRLFLKHPDEADTVVIEELGLCRGQVRVDVAVVNGLLHGYEIKSDRDSLRRALEVIDGEPGGGLEYQRPQAGTPGRPR